MPHNLIISTNQDCSIARTIEFGLTDNLWIHPFKLLLITVLRFDKS